MSPFEKALQKVRQRQMTHEDRSEGDRRVRDALKTMADFGYDISSIPFQMLTYSPEAEGAFIGPKGIDRLKKAGKNVKEMYSYLLGQPRAEVNPPIHSNVWWEMGNISQQVKNALKNKNTSPMLRDIISPDEFPDLATAYPELFKTKVNLKPTTYDSPMKASFVPDLDETGDRSVRLLDRLLERYNRSNPMPKPKISVRPTDEEIAEFDKWKSVFDRQLSEKLGIEYEEGVPFFDYELSRALEKYVKPKATGEINLTFPETSFADRPGRDLADSLLHELQHAIQNIENNGDMMALYHNADKDIAENIIRSYYNRYNDVMSPYFGPAPNQEFRPIGKGLNYFKDSVQLDDLALRDWIDSLGWREKSIVQEEFSGDFWPPSINSYESFRAKNPDLNAPDVSKYHAEVPKRYTYKMNPFEREAFEASRRDVDPQYRESYYPKTLNEINDDTAQGY